MEMDTMTVVIADDPRLPECAPIRGHHATRDRKKTNRDAVDIHDRDHDHGLRLTTVHGTSALQQPLSVVL
jgi:hypothetical protein